MEDQSDSITGHPSVDSLRLHALMSELLIDRHQRHHIYTFMYGLWNIDTVGSIYRGTEGSNTQKRVGFKKMG